MLEYKTAFLYHCMSNFYTFVNILKRLLTVIFIQMSGE